MKELKFALIYPKYLNANGDFGNVMMMKQRAEINNVDFSLESIEVGDKIEPEKYDFFYIGGAPDEFNPFATKELLTRKDDFLKIKETEKTLLGVCYGYQMLGNQYKFIDDKYQLDGLGLLDLFTVEKQKRRVGNVTSKMAFMVPNYLVGFENHRGSTYLNSSVKPLSYVDIGFGNNGSDKTEGAISNTIVGTYLTGPFLPRNVYFADYLLKITMEHKYQEEFSLVDEENTLEEDVHFDFIKVKY